jgi:hypothetical protein
MSIGAAITLPPIAGQAITRTDLLRLEGFGDNCEFGFVLRRLGFEDGMLFRWASIRPESLLATLRGDFADLYEFDNLVPQNPKMVRDLHYGTSWHTKMYSSRQGGTLAFDANDADRRAIHSREALKLAYLVEKLRNKFNHPNPVFVVKANNGISEDLLEAIHYQIYRRAVSPGFLLLEVRQDAARAGTVELLDRNRMRGYVTHFAPYDKSDQADDANWIAILTRALAQNAEAPVVSAVHDSTPEVVVLPFPTASDLLGPVLGDLRGGMATLIGGNGWCRPVGDDVYRLHAAADGVPTRLQWTGVHLPRGYGVNIRAACAIEQSLPVRAILQIAGADGETLRSQHIFDATAEQRFCLLLPENLPNPLTVALSVETLSPLGVGQRAVIDVLPITAAPSTELAASTR